MPSFLRFNKSFVLAMKRLFESLIGKQNLLGIVHFAVVATSLTIIYSTFPQFYARYYTFMAHVLLGIIITRFLLFFTKHIDFKQRIQPRNKAVLITGCRAGFGHQFAKRLDSKGFIVFAGFHSLPGKEADELKKHCSNNLKVLELDVTKDDSVRQAVRFVKENLGFSELWAIVNNAGIQGGLHVDLTPVEVFQKVMDVNAFGCVRVTKAFLPFLKKSKGRVVNISSIAVWFRSPYAAAYAMSKSAIAAFTECFRKEALFWGVRVICIEPELFSTPMTDTAAHKFEDFLNSADEGIKKEYGHQYFRGFKSYLETYFSYSCVNLDPVVDALESAIALKYPMNTYKVGRNLFVEILLYVIEHMLKPVVDIYFTTRFIMKGILPEALHINT